MTSKVAKQDKQEPEETAEKSVLQTFHFPELGVSVEAATLQEATGLAKTKKEGKSNG